ncbi:MAG: hypothetical protein ACQRW7_00370 [Caulobacterales bacterium]|uniref:hypothetical protein n=1 Tax=Glycocaulis sp. TaxID=1969725 RepID=UPI003FA0D93A
MVPSRQTQARLILTAMLALVCLVPPALMLAPPAGGTMLAVFAPGGAPGDRLLAAAAAGAEAAEPLRGGVLVRIEMPDASEHNGPAALREHGALFVLAPLSGWSCPPGTSDPTEIRS